MRSKINWPKTLLYYAVVLLSAFVVYNVFFPIRVRDKYSMFFSAERVVSDLKIIDKSNFSSERSENEVKDYLFYRLKQMGGAVLRFRDSTTFDGEKIFGVSGVYSEFFPVDSNNNNGISDNGSVLLIANLGSACDSEDYGIGIVLELVTQALRYREYWKQGVKVLFTYAQDEKSGAMDGIWKNEKYIFRRVNLAIRIGACGNDGPVILSWISDGNAKLIDFYKQNVRKPNAYSMPGLIYGKFPCLGDNSSIGDSIPEYYVSAIGNYDCSNYVGGSCSGLSLKTIQLYGIQLEPLLHNYLTCEKYSGDVFRSKKNNVFFTIPGLGMLYFSKSEYEMLDILSYIIFIFVLLYYLHIGKVHVRKMLAYAAYSSLFFAGSFVAGTMVAFFCSLVSGRSFSIFGLCAVRYDYFVIIITSTILFLWILIFYRMHEKRAKSLICYDFLFGVLFLSGLLAFVIRLISIGNFFLLIPFAAGSVVLLLGMARGLRFVYLLGACMVSLLGFSFVYYIHNLFSFGALGITLAITSLYMLLLVSEYYCFKRDFL